MIDDTAPLLSILVLDFRKEKETRECLESLRAHIKVKDYEIVLLDNGGAVDYAWWLYQEDLCDVLISKKKGLGGGVGQTDLFRWTRSPYSLFVQNDQVLVSDIDDKLLSYFIDLLNNGYKCVDLNGDQSHAGIWTDRAHLIKTEVFNSFSPFPNGAPGKMHDKRWNENYMQEMIKPKEIAHIKPALFVDKGVWSIREQPDGSLLKMRTDTKQLWWQTRPREKFVFPELNEQEWADSIAGSWVGGTIPEAYKQHSFNCWGDV